MKREEKFQNLDRIINWINNCDTKSSIILTLQGLILSILFTSDFKSVFIEAFSRKFILEFKFIYIKNFIEGVLLLLFLYYNFKQFVFTLKTIKARIEPEVYTEVGLTSKSSLFFGSISKLSFGEFKNITNNTSTELEENDLESQIFINSKICNVKFSNYNKAIEELKKSVYTCLLYVIITLANNV